MAVIEDVCDRVIVMADGGIVADSDVETLVETVGGDRLQIKSNDLTPRIVSRLRERITKTALNATIDSDSDPHIEVEISEVSLYRLFNILEGADVEIEQIQTIEVGLEEALIELTSTQSQADTQTQVGSVDESHTKVGDPSVNKNQQEAKSPGGTEISTDSIQRSNHSESDMGRSREHDI